MLGFIFESWANLRPAQVHRINHLSFIPAVALRINDRTSPNSDFWNKSILSTCPDHGHEQESTQLSICSGRSFHSSIASSSSSALNFVVIFVGLSWLLTQEGRVR